MSGKSKITAKEVYLWLGDDSKEDISVYLARAINFISDGSMTLDELKAMIKEEASNKQ